MPLIIGKTVLNFTGYFYALAEMVATALFCFVAFESLALP
jgi:hypothetical protein